MTLCLQYELKRTAAKGAAANGEGEVRGKFPPLSVYICESPVFPDFLLQALSGL